MYRTYSLWVPSLCRSSRSLRSAREETWSRWIFSQSSVTSSLKKWCNVMLRQNLFTLANMEEDAAVQCWRFAPSANPIYSLRRWMEFQDNCQLLMWPKLDRYYLFMWNTTSVFVNSPHQLKSSTSALRLAFSNIQINTDRNHQNPFPFPLVTLPHQNVDGGANSISSETKKSMSRSVESSSVCQ